MKKDYIGNYKIDKIPRIAQVIDDYVTEAKKKNTVWGLADCDVTEVRRILHDYTKKTGEKISFTAFLISCYSRVVEKYKYPINTLKKGKNRYCVFDDVDVMTNIEKTLPSGIKKPLNYTIRKANEKTLREINDELQTAKMDKGIRATTQQKKTFNLVKLFPKLPRFIRRLFLRSMFTNPMRRKRFLGTVGMTAVGMLGTHGKGYGHGVFITPHTVGVAVAGIQKKPVIIDDKIVQREILAMTIALDHSLVDGGPATRFGSEFLYMIEEGCIEEEWCFKSLKT
ncbi:MAG: 2-oxo acid dehydrogenase subunit E2 [Promethearchaeota archaeon]